MKTTYTSIAAVVIMAVVSGSAFAEGSKIEGSELINTSSNTNNLGLAIGDNSNANTGSISVKGSEVKGSKVINGSVNTNNLGLAIGQDSSANTGSIDIK